VLAQSEDGSRCTELGALLSAYCDGEASAAEAATVREHLRACPSCRATMRTYRAAPGAVAAFLPALPLGRSLLDRAHQALADAAARLGGGAGDATASQVAIAGGTRGAGAAALAKVLAICAGTAGGAIACVASGVVPAPFELEQKQKAPAIERKVSGDVLAGWSEGNEPTGDLEETPAATPEPKTAGDPDPAETVSEPAAEPELQEATTAPAVEAAPEAAPVVAPPVSSAPPPSSPTQSGSAAGEFGP
jgi:hypothetical protein